MQRFRTHMGVGFLAIVAAVSVACGGSEQPGEGAGTTDPDVATERHPDLNAFLASPAATAMPAERVVFIGIDGASWEFIDPLIERGLLPNLARVKREGSTGRLRSIPCFVSPPAWATMLTGALPERTGVYTFGEWDPQAQSFTNVNAENVHVPAVWDVASYCGRKVGVFNVPMTFPPHAVNGAVVTGMMTPYEMAEPAPAKPVRAGSVAADARAPQSFSPVRRSATDDSLNVYHWSLFDTIDDGEKAYDRVGLVVEWKTQPPRRHSHWFNVDAFSPWIQIRALVDGEPETVWRKVAVVRMPDGGYDTRISPSFEPIASAYTYPDTLADVLAERFGYYVPSAFVATNLVSAFARDAASSASFLYNQDRWDLFMYVFTQSDNIHHLTGFSPQAEEVYHVIDAFIGRVMKAIEGRGTLVIASDHGFGEYTYGVDYNRFLEHRNLLRWKSPEEINYDETIVFHNLWHLYFNEDLLTHTELRSRGFDIGDQEDPAAFLRRYLEETPITSADGSRSLTTWYRSYQDDARQPAPSLILGGTHDDTVIDFLGNKRHDTVFRRLEGEERFWHTRDGVFMAWGEGIAAGSDAGTRDIQDVAPTLLYLLGAPVAEDLDGRLVNGILAPRAGSIQTLQMVPNYDPIPRSVASGKGKQALEKKLRNLGYMQ